MTALIEFLQTSFSYIGPFTVLLGLLIFVHEFGHFIVAKWCGVRVEVFSLGFGKKILSYKHNETTYCVSLIPLGGYVKMFGDDPTAQIAEEDKKGAFLHKPVSQRIAIVLAGPLMNLFFAAATFAVIAYIGEKQAAPIVGDIEPGTAAAEAGFQSGDRILSVDGIAVTHWEQIEEHIKDNPNKTIRFQVEHQNLVNTDSAGTTAEITAPTVLAKNENLLSTKRMVGKIEGLEIVSTASVVAVEHNSLADAAGLPKIATIHSVNGEEVNFLRHLEALLQKYRGQELTVEASDFLIEESEKKTYQLQSLYNDNIFEAYGFNKSDLNIYQVKEASPAEEAGFIAGDRVLAAGGKKLNHWKELVEQVKSYDGNGSPMSFTVLRDGKEISLLATPQLTDLLKPSGADDNRYTIGIIPAVAMAAEKPVIITYKSLWGALSRGAAQSWKWTKTVMISFVRMLQNEVSAKNIGSVISIGKFAGQSYQIGITAFLNLMAIISINLFLINLFPVPVLDGGHLVFFTIEAIRGAPLSMRKMEVAQQVGLIILMSLMAFALFNDISNILNPPF